jgi:hypothetical protein
MEPQKVVDDQLIFTLGKHSREFRRQLYSIFDT